MIDSGATHLPITDKRMTRFWITLEQSVAFVVNALNRMRGGEVYVPKIPSMHIEDLAKAFAPGMPLTYTGIREGEKLHELMIGIDDARHTLEYEDHFMIVPETISHSPELLEKYLKGRKGQKLPDDFSYTSNTNHQWLTVEQLKSFLGTLMHY